VGPAGVPRPLAVNVAVGGKHRDLPEWIGA